MAQPGEVPRQLTRHWTGWSWWDPGQWRWAPPLDTPSIIRQSTVKLDHSKETRTSPLRVFAIKSYDTLPKRETGAVIDCICVRIWGNDDQGMVPAWEEVTIIPQKLTSFGSTKGPRGVGYWSWKWALAMLSRPTVVKSVWKNIAGNLTPSKRDDQYFISEVMRYEHFRKYKKIFSPLNWYLLRSCRCIHVVL